MICDSDLVGFSVYYTACFRVAVCSNRYTKIVDPSVSQILELMASGYVIVVELDNELTDGSLEDVYDYFRGNYSEIHKMDDDYYDVVRYYANWGGCHWACGYRDPQSALRHALSICKVTDRE